MVTACSGGFGNHCAIYFANHHANNRATNQKSPYGRSAITFGT